MSDDRDIEVVAMQSVHDALAPLSRAACSRVLSWAEKRYTKLDIADSDLEAFTKFTEALVEAARTIDGVTPLDIIRFADVMIEAKGESGGA